MQDQGNGNRRTPRRAFERLVGLLYRGNYRVCKAKQISEGGLMLQTNFVLKPQEQAVVSVLLPGGGHAVVRVEALYAVPGAAGQQPGYGFRFLNLPFQTRRLIRNYIAAKTQSEAESERKAQIQQRGSR